MIDNKLITKKPIFLGPSKLTSFLYPHSAKEDLLSTLNCAIGKRGAVYVSGPITTGRRFVNWFLDIGQPLEDNPNVYKHALQQAVIQPNESDILGIAESLRLHSPIPVIQPASLKISSWDQKSYYQFWESVIEQYVVRVVVINGWQCSVGCAIEFQYAVECGIPVETDTGKAVSPEIGSALMLDAAIEIEQKCATSDKLKRIANSLRACAMKDKV